MQNQTTDSVLMIRPSRFGFNDETACTNPFQNKNGVSGEEIHSRAILEFDSFSKKLKEEGIKVYVFQDTPQPPKPDSIFPNNWVSFHEDGTIITYPMYAPNRRAERRQDIFEELKKSFILQEVIDLSVHEKSGIFLEGTGSLVLDRINKIAYACLSPRTHKSMLEIFSKKAGYRTVSFHAKDISGNLLYHTNVMMFLGEKFAVVCEEAVIDKNEKEALFYSLEKTGHEIITISFEQYTHYAGNGLELKNSKGEKILVMSEQARSWLTESQLSRLSRHCRILTHRLDTIEHYGGGSARCMLAEIFLPKK